MTILKSVEFNPHYGIDYPDNTEYSVLNGIAALAVTAYSDQNSNAQNLTLGASSNVNIEAYEGVNMYFTEQNAVTLYNTSTAGSVRTDTPILKIHNDSATTFLASSNFMLNLTGQDSVQTTTVSQTTLFTSNSSQCLQTPLGNGFVFEKTVTIPNLYASSNIVAQHNIACGGNMFTTSLNLYKNESNNAQVAYAFYINEYDQLDLIRFNKTTNLVTETVTSHASRIATFGKFTDSNTGNINDYTVLNEFNGLMVGGTGSGSTGSTTGVTTLTWNSGPSSNSVYYNAGNVGIGTMSPTEALQVVGNARIGGIIYPDSSNMYDLGKVGYSFRNVYANTLNINGAILDTDITGAVIIEGTDNVQINMTSLQTIVNETFLNAEWSSNAIGSGSVTSSGGSSQWTSGVNDIYILSSNVGIGNSSLGATLDITGTLNVSSGINQTVYISQNKVGINNINPAANLDITGTANISSSLNVRGSFCNNQNAYFNSNVTVMGTLTAANVNYSNVTVYNTQSVQGGDVTMSNSYGSTQLIGNAIIFSSWS